MFSLNTSIRLVLLFHLSTKMSSADYFPSWSPTPTIPLVAVPALPRLSQPSSVDHPHSLGLHLHPFIARSPPKPSPNPA